jgi:FKBP-type peptidyl-prolyl cis-trans isomerase
MMQRKSILVATFGGLLLLGACESAMNAGLGCSVIRHNVVGTNGDTVNLASGLRYIELQAGTPPIAQSCREATVRYTGYLRDGGQFDHNTIPLIPGTGRLIAGFEQGVVGMSTGSIRRVIMPPELAYGSVPRTNPQGEVVIPANSTLVFDLELLVTN